MRIVKLFDVYVEIEDVICPMLIGDGITDDTDNLEWYILRGLPIPSKGIKGSRYLITRTINISRDVILIKDSK